MNREHLLNRIIDAETETLKARVGYVSAQLEEKVLRARYAKSRGDDTSCLERECAALKDLREELLAKLKRSGVLR